MSNTKKEFMVMYDEAVDLLKKFKQSNDNLNKSIGVDQDQSITLKIRAQQATHNAIIKKLDDILNKLQQSYLDPDTARKIGTVKQQYKIQKDRRLHIQKSLIQIPQNHSKIPHETSQTEHTFSYRPKNNDYKNNSTKRSPNSKQRESYSTSSTAATQMGRQNEEQITEYDYEIECKLLEQKNRAIAQSQKKIMNVYNITKECQEMVHYQGEHIDMISDHMYRAKENTQEAVKQIREANVQSQKRRKKIFTFSILLVIAVTILLLFLFI